MDERLELLIGSRNFPRHFFSVVFSLSPTPPTSTVSRIHFIHFTGRPAIRGKKCEFCFGNRGSRSQEKCSRPLESDNAGGSKLKRATGETWPKESLFLRSGADLTGAKESKYNAKIDLENGKSNSSFHIF